MNRAAPALALACLLLVPASGAFACDRDDYSPTIRLTDWKEPVRWTERHDPDDARLAISTRGNKATLLITDEVVAMQLSERTFAKIQKKLAKERDEEEDHALARAIKTAVLSSVVALLDHSAECSVDDIRDVDYRNGRLVFVSEDGDRLFESVEVDDDDLTTAFSERDARAFVREFRRVKARRS
jgi:hypothetical protein